MKKSLIALAALAAVSAASAQSSVTLYGVIDVGYGVHNTTTRDGSGTIRTQGVMDGANAGNRIGFRGTEDLGGGLKANFVIEQGISPTSPELFGVRAGASGHQITGFSAAGSATALSGAAGAYTTATNRQSYIGLSSGIGTFNIGYQYTILYELGTLSGYNAGSEGAPGADKAHIHGLFGVGGTRANMIQYISPNFGGGFTARVQYGAGTGREAVSNTSTTGTNGLTTDNARRMGLMLQYANGPLSASVAYTNYRVLQQNTLATGLQAPAGVATSAYGVAGAAGAVALSGVSRTANLFQLGSSYDFGVAKIMGTYNSGKNGGAATSPAGPGFNAVGAVGGNVPNGTPGFNFNYRSYQLGVSAPFGAFVPFITYGRARTNSDNINGTGATAGVLPVVGLAATDRVEDYRSYQLGVRYSLSKRTTAYAFYGQTINNAAALNGNASFYKDSKTIVGLAHSF